MKQLLIKGIDYISSEEYGDDCSKLYVRPLSWLKTKYSKNMKELDVLHFNSLSAKPKGVVKRPEDSEASTRLKRSKPLDFAIVNHLYDSLSSVLDQNDHDHE